MPQHCGSCGKDNRATARFCIQCGKPIEDAPLDPTAAEPAPESARQPIGARAFPRPGTARRRLPDNPRRSGHALASFLLGIIPLGLEAVSLPFALVENTPITGGVIFGGIIELAAFVLAIIIGVKAKRDIAESQGRLSGSGLATAGFIMGIIGAGLTVLGFAILFSAASQPSRYYRGY